LSPFARPYRWWDGASVGPALFNLEGKPAWGRAFWRRGRGRGLVT
jgi:hypothetical protein